MKRSTRWILEAVGVLFILASGATWYFLAQVAPVSSAYAAKRMCSCVFVSHRDAKSVHQEELKKYRYIHIDIDRGKKTVTSSILGMMKRTAVFRNGLGCTLAIGISEKMLRRQAAGFRLAHPDRKNIPWPDGDKITDPPLPASVDAQKLNMVLDWAFYDPDPVKARRTRAVIVVSDGRIIAERYAAGFTKKTPLPGWSMTKSVTNALVGILIKEGKLKVETPVTPAPVAEWRLSGDPRCTITFNQLMCMCSGLKFQEDYNDPTSDVVRMLFAEYDSGAYAASKPLETLPESRWHYSSGSTNIISRIVRQSIKGPLSDYFNFPRQALFSKIGMTSAIIEPDPSGTFVGSSFMFATARDWARFGLLCLNDGVWNKKRILPEGWMKYSTTPAPKAPQGNYGAQFWLNAGSPGNPGNRWMPKVPPDMYSLYGDEGQYVTVIPSKKLVIVRLGLTVPEKNWDHAQFIEDIITAVSGHETIRPAIHFIRN